MATTINNIKVDFGLGANPPRVTFLQGANMDVTNIRDTIRQIEESTEGRDAPGAVSSKGDAKGWIARAGGNFEFSSAESSALTVQIMPPFDIFFEAGPIPFQTSLGSLLGTFSYSPGAIVQVNNAIGASNLNSEDIEYASFAGGVWYDVVNGKTGTVFPAGTERQPVNNFTDLLTIAQQRGFNNIFIVGDATLDAGLNYDNYTIKGQGQNLSRFVIPESADVNNCSFLDAEITGTLDGGSYIQRCIVSDLSFVSGVIENSVLDAGTIVLGGSETAHFINCMSGVPGISTPIIDMGGTGQPLAMRSYNGGIEIRNKTGTDKVSIDLNSGHVILDSSVDVTLGDVVIRGIGKLTDNSTGAQPVNELVSGVEIKDMYTRFDLDSDRPQTYANDGSTIINSDFTLTKTDNGNGTSTVTRS